MAEPPERSLPSLGRMSDALADLDDVVNFVLGEEQRTCVDLLGYSWGAARSASFYEKARGRVRQLALYAPVWRPLAGEPLADICNPTDSMSINAALGGYSKLSESQLKSLWDWEIDSGDWRDYREPEALKAAGNALLASDPTWPWEEIGFRAPNGPKLDALKVQRGECLFDAGKVDCEVMLVRGAQDKLSSEKDANDLFGAIGSLRKRHVTIGLGTHLLHLEHNRTILVNELVNFFRSHPSIVC
jgi:pimeloyl-ACP methyl ester carboxylesterase